MMRWALSLAFSALPLTAALAQEPVAVGDRIRVTAPSYGLQARIGTVRSVSNDRLEFRPADSTKSVEVGYRAISSLEKSAGKKASVVQGVLYGGGAGILIGGVLGTSCGRSLGSDSCAGPRIAAGAGIGILAGAIFGLTVLRTDRWVTIQLPTGGGSLGLGARLQF